MQYDTIILELLSRIQKLEEEVDFLKQMLPESIEKFQKRENDLGTTQDSNTPYKKMTDEMIELCYKYGVRVHKGENIQEFADDIANETRMNRNSAIMYMQVVCSMLDGTIYKRAISSKALQKYLNKIWNDFGRAAFEKAIVATRLHIEYRKEFGHPVESIEEICAKAEKRL